MSKLERPVNDYARVMHILIDSYIAGVSMAKVLNNYAPNFYKFQTRLSDIQRAHPKLKISKSLISSTLYDSAFDAILFPFNQYSPSP